MDPTLLLIGGGLLALVLGHEIFSDDDDDDDDDDNDVDDDDDGGTVTPPPPKVVIKDQVATGTAGADTIVQDVDATGTANFVEAHGAAGNDTIQMDGGGDAYGDAGDDVIEVSDPTGGDPANEVRNIIDGGAGNDQLTVSPYAADILGGSGNDTITYDEEYIDWYRPSTIDAGEGDDLVEAEIEIGSSNEVPQITLGAGNDTLVAEIDMDNIGLSTLPDELSHDNFKGSETAFEVKDFDPPHDVLTIEPDTDPENLNGGHIGIAYAGYEIVELDGNTLVHIRYAIDPPDIIEPYTQYPGELTATVQLTGVTGLPAAAIQIVTN